MDQGKMILDQVIRQTTGLANPHSLEQAEGRFAFDIRLPQPVTDAFSGEVAWAQAVLPGKFVDIANTASFDESFWMKPTVKPANLSELLRLWNDVNVMAASRHLDSSDVEESDNIYSSQHVVRSIDVTSSRHVLWCDRVEDCEYVVATQRSRDCAYALRVEDSRNCAESISVSWSRNVVKSAFIHDCADIYESLFCAHLRGKKYCIANMQFDEATYFAIKPKVMRWVVGGGLSGKRGSSRSPTD